MRRLLAATAVVGLVAFPVAAVGATAARADPVSACTTTNGTIVAVDFGQWGGPVVRGCGVGDSTGLALLQSAGFGPAGTFRWGLAFICRLGNAAFAGGTQYPTPSRAQPCVDTPPTSAYWSYWLAPLGQDTWSYASRGVTSERPLTGEVEMWSFGATTLDGSSGSGRPTISPDSLRAAPGTGVATGPTSQAPQAPAPLPTEVVVKADLPTRAALPPGRSTRAPAGPAISATPARSCATLTPTRGTCPPARATTASTGAVAIASSSAAADAFTVQGRGGGRTSVVSALPASDAQPDRGSVLPAVLGGGLAVLLALGGGTTVWRRRRDA